MRLSRTRHRRRELHRRLQTRPRILAEYIRYGSDGSTLAFLPTTARTTDLWLPDASGVYQQYGNGEVGIIDGNAVWCQPAATNYADGDDDLSGGAETIDLTSAGTGNYTLSVIGTAAVTVAAGTAVGTGFGQATEGSPVTFNLSTAGTVTLTLDSGSLDTIGSSAAKQIEKNAFATSFIPTPAGTPVAISATQPVVSWPSGLVNDFVVSMDVSAESTASQPYLFQGYLDDSNTFDIQVNASPQLVVAKRVGGAYVNNAASIAGYDGSVVKLTVLFSSVRGVRSFFGGELKNQWSNTDNIPTVTIASIGWARRFNQLRNLGRISNLRIIKVDPYTTDAQVLALP